MILDLLPKPQHCQRTGHGIPAGQRVAGGEPANEYPSARFCGVSQARVVDRLRILLPAGLPKPLDIEIRQAADTIPQLHEDESYELTIDDNRISLYAATTWGALHGVTTLYQLSQHGQLRAPLNIVDFPRYAWRGVLIDCARHFIPIALLQRVVEGMALLKLNVLHLHLTDDQAFRFASREFPDLASSQAYTAPQLAGLVDFAARRGVRIVPEFDVPGHVTSWLVNYPHLGFSQVSPSERFGVHPACLDPTRAEVYTFLKTLFTEVAQVFPDTYLHIGGDEVHPEWWTKDPAVQQFMLANKLEHPADLQNYFNRQLCAIVREIGKQPVAWDEVLHPEMPGMLVQNWRGATTRDRILDKGLGCLVSAGYYLDLHYPNEFHYRYDPGASQRILVQTEDEWQADPRLDHVAEGIEWTRQWRAEQIEVDVDTTGVIGGEACLWSELVDEHTLEIRLWSRLPSVAERLWSAQSAVDINDFYRRLETTLGMPQFAIAGQQEDKLSAMGFDAARQAVINLLEPVKWYARLLGEAALQARLEGSEMPQARPYDTRSLFNRVVDVISPESFPARTLGGAPWTELGAHARLWRQLNPEEWPPDLHAAIEGMVELGEIVERRCARQISDAQCRRSLEPLLKPRGEYMLAVVPFLLKRVAA